MRYVRTAVAVLVLAVSPLAHAAPCGGFTDVDDANPAHAPFCASVEWMKNRRHHARAHRDAVLPERPT